MSRRSLYDDPYEQFTVGELTVKIVSDPEPTNPRKEWDNAGTMVCWHRRYDLGDEQPSIDPGEYLERLAFEIHPELEDYFGNGLFTKMVTVNWNHPQYKAQQKAYNEKRREIAQTVLDKHYVILPLYLYDHGGITMSCSEFGDPWDSGQVGFIYCNREKVQEEWGKYHPDENWQQLSKRATEVLKGEVETYDQYLRGDVYGFVVEDEDGEHLDSCWGFFGDKYAAEEGKSAAENEWDSIVEKRALASAREYHAQLWDQRMMAV